MPINYGSELSCTLDVDPNGSMVSGGHLIAEALYRRVITPRGRVIDDPNYGTDLTQYINDDQPKSAQAQIQAAVVQECLKDERVLQCTCTTSLNSIGVMSITIYFIAAPGPFTLVLAATPTSVNILSVT